MNKKITVIVGARPNFMKAAPVLKEILQHPDSLSAFLIHTGQHYDHNLSKLFFEDLGMPNPDLYLGVGSGSHAEQTAKIMVELEIVMMKRRPDLVMVFGDVNSTLAGALVASKLCIPLSHVEAGLRSFDKTMPEEINRMVADCLADYLFVTEKSGMENLLREGVNPQKIIFVGNTMIDSLVGNLEAAQKSGILDQLSLKPRGYAVLTLHRPSNVDDIAILSSLLEVISTIGRKTPVVFPCHPRTRKELNEFGLLDKIDKDAIRIVEPLGYLDFLKLQSESKFVLTDSGGIQEETTYLGIPCITLRESTERPITAELGTNVITGIDPGKIISAANSIIDGKMKKSRIPELWDGKAARRIVNFILGN
jgi:UDP-N-acetylglucosamine 2-epimerase (non-hydrolysing)